MPIWLNCLLLYTILQGCNFFFPDIHFVKSNRLQANSQGLLQTVLLFFIRIKKTFALTSRMFFVICLNEEGY